MKTYLNRAMDSDWKKIVIIFLNNSFLPNNNYFN